MKHLLHFLVHGLVRRPPAGAWIETAMDDYISDLYGVAPLRGRGLKQRRCKIIIIEKMSPPCGGVD